MAESDSKSPKPQPDLTGRTLGDFHILRRIGAGGMGQVYLARQTSLKREVALKLLRGELNTNPTALARFQAEAQAVAKLNHPNIVHIHQIGEADGLRYMVLEYVEGRNLREYLMRKGPPDVPITLSVIRQVALALQKAHEQGIVHRDIKPENILVTRKVEVKVTDFGLSRFFSGEEPATHLTQSGVTLGTPLYMSPEQVQGHTVDHRSDIYSFGVTCYHLLAGEPPFRGASAFDVALKHVQDQPRPLGDLRPDLPAELCAAVHKMMAKNPDQRFQSAKDVLRDLQKVRDGLSSANVTLVAMDGAMAPGGVSGGATEAMLSLMRSGSVAIPPPAARSRRRWLLAGAGLLGIVLGFLTYLVSHRVRNPRLTAAAALPGLPDVRPPEKFVTTRERELHTVLNTEGAKPDEVIRASIELGLLLLKERRAAEANERFEKLKARAADFRDQVAARTGNLIARLGIAVVLAHEQKTKESYELFEKLVAEQPPKFSGAKSDGVRFDRPAAAVTWLLFRHPDLGTAVADALNRDAVGLGKTKLEPAVLEQIRNSQRGVR